MRLTQLPPLSTSTNSLPGLTKRLARMTRHGFAIATTPAWKALPLAFPGYPTSSLFQTGTMEAVTYMSSVRVSLLRLNLAELKWETTRQLPLQSQRQLSSARLDSRRHLSEISRQHREGTFFRELVSPDFPPQAKSTRCTLLFRMPTNSVALGRRH